MDKFLEEFYVNAERNIVGYKRPADWQQRLERIKSKKRYPATEGDKQNGKQTDI